MNIVTDYASMIIDKEKLNYNNQKKMFRKDPPLYDKNNFFLVKNNQLDKICMSKIVKYLPKIELIKLVQVNKRYGFINSCTYNTYNVNNYDLFYHMIEHVIYTNKNNCPKWFIEDVYKKTIKGNELSMYKYLNTTLFFFFDKLENKKIPIGMFNMINNYLLNFLLSYFVSSDLKYFTINKENTIPISCTTKELERFLVREVMLIDKDKMIEMYRKDRYDYCMIEINEIFFHLVNGRCNNKFKYYIHFHGNYMTLGYVSVRIPKANLYSSLKGFSLLKPIKDKVTLIKSVDMFKYNEENEIEILKRSNKIDIRYYDIMIVDIQYKCGEMYERYAKIILNKELYNYIIRNNYHDLEPLIYKENECSFVYLNENYLFTFFKDKTIDIKRIEHGRFGTDYIVLGYSIFRYASFNPEVFYFPISLMYYKYGIRGEYDFVSNVMQRLDSKYIMNYSKRKYDFLMSYYKNM